MSVGKLRIEYRLPSGAVPVGHVARLFGTDGEAKASYTDATLANENPADLAIGGEGWVDVWGFGRGVVRVYDADDSQVSTWNVEFVSAGVVSWGERYAAVGVFSTERPVARGSDGVLYQLTGDASVDPAGVGGAANWERLSARSITFPEWTEAAAQAGLISNTSPFSTLGGEFFILKEGGNPQVSPDDDVSRSNWLQLRSDTLRQVKAQCFEPVSNAATDAWHTLACVNLPNFRRTGNHSLDMTFVTAVRQANPGNDLQARLTPQNESNVAVAGETLLNVSAITTAVSSSHIGIQLRRYTLRLSDITKITLPTANADNLRLGQMVTQDGAPFKAGYVPSGIITALDVSGANTIVSVNRTGDTVALASVGATAQVAALAVYNPVKEQLGLPDQTLAPATDSSGNPYQVNFNLSGKPPFLATEAGLAAVRTKQILSEDETHSAGNHQFIQDGLFSFRMNSIDIDALEDALEDAPDMTLHIQARYRNGQSGYLGLISALLTYEEN